MVSYVLSIVQLFLCAVAFTSAVNENNARLVNGSVSTNPIWNIIGILDELQETVKTALYAYPTENRTDPTNGTGICGVENIRVRKNLTVSSDSTNATFSAIEDDGFITRVTCCPGYHRDYTGFCVPHCAEGEDLCLYGKCVSPGNCACLDGYALDRSNSCTPTYPKGCLIGICSGNSCKCSDGYAADGIVCMPVCKNACQNGICVLPNVCACEAGYEKDPADPTGYKCKPSCADGCEHGDCTSPETCECYPGYERDDNGGCTAV